LFKIGAAATFIKRGDKVETIKVSALPMGIVDSIRISHIELQARRGDEIIIVSDGITEADRTDGQMEWIRETIEHIRSRDPQTMSDLIVNKAMERYGLKEKDDMTVITAIVS
jgi:stage II sporulation protein E